MAIVRHALPLDLAAVDVIERASFGDPWSLQSFRQSLARTFVRINVAEDEGTVLSATPCSGWRARSANWRTWPSIRKRRGSGLGTLLLDAGAAGGARGRVRW